MRNFLRTILAAVAVATASLASAGIIPAPVVFEEGTGSLTLNDQVVVSVSGFGENNHAVTKQTAQLLDLYGIANVHGVEAKAQVLIGYDKGLAAEEYILVIGGHHAKIKASTPTGAFYAMQSLVQLLNGNTLPYCFIHDYPRFDYRGLMLDVARLFIPKEEVMKIIDIASSLKINKLHLHLCDDNGWRLEIKKYPKLTSVGAWRVDRPQLFPGRMNPKPGEPTPVGGFYTQSDMRQIVEYAQKHHVQVIPEIELPAHSVAALAAYPELACPVVDKFIGVLPGIGGHNAEIIYCAGNDKVFDFLQDVFTEVLDIFPSKQIHIGGDEATKTYWETCPLCQQRIKDEGLEDEEQLQGYFVTRIKKFLMSKGREVLGWDEVFDSNAGDTDITIFGWRGDGGAAYKAAERGHRVVLTPAKVNYLIRYQGPQWWEPVTYFGNNTIENVFDFEPKKVSDPSRIWGTQASLWTEFCANTDDVEYLLFPRVMAFADASWRQSESKNALSFLSSLDHFLLSPVMKDVVYAKSMFNIDHSVTHSNGALAFSAACCRPDVDVRYVVDGELNAESPKLTGAVQIDKSCNIKCASFQGKEQMGQTLSLDIMWNKATARPVTGDGANLHLLTNGTRGRRHSDFCWVQGRGQDMTFTVDLGAPTSINTVVLGTIAYTDMCVAGPSHVQLLVSDDGVNFNKLDEKKISPKLYFSKSSLPFDVAFKKKAVTRYIRLVATNPGAIPPSFPRADVPTTMYFDEIMVK